MSSSTKRRRYRWPWEPLERKYPKPERRLFWPLWQLRARIAFVRGKRLVMEYAKRQGWQIIEEKEEHPLEKL